MYTVIEILDISMGSSRAPRGTSARAEVPAPDENAAAPKTAAPEAAAADQEATAES
jgi:hypothetical protein